jgi:uncharacterized protein YggU (UPF0235/DUF167 family)
MRTIGSKVVVGEAPVDSAYERRGHDGKIRRPVGRCDRLGPCGLTGPVRRRPGHTGIVRITIRVRPGAAHPGVGGEHDGALVVRVSARAVDGHATAAALAAVAWAFGVRSHAVTLVTGKANRTKILEVAGADPAVLDRLLAQQQPHDAKRLT